mmetsp:Transcript_24325/g.78448  ORF Transcript_24325/g.78448 Transcript_24325/m.78448 type:complete len:213 (-) Transcript_24325:939-1577(-)
MRWMWIAPRQPPVREAAVGRLRQPRPPSLTRPARRTWRCSSASSSPRARAACTAPLSTPRRTSHHSVRRLGRFLPSRPQPAPPLFCALRRRCRRRRRRCSWRARAGRPLRPAPTSRLLSTPKAWTPALFLAARRLACCSDRSRRRRCRRRRRRRCGARWWRPGRSCVRRRCSVGSPNTSPALPPLTGCFRSWWEDPEGRTPIETTCSPWRGT